MLSAGLGRSTYRNREAEAETSAILALIGFCILFAWLNLYQYRLDITSRPKDQTMRYLTGSLAFLSYILHIYARWGRLTFRRYGLLGVLSPSYRPRRAAVGYGVRIASWKRGHSNLTGGTRVWSLLAQLERERTLIA